MKELPTPDLSLLAPQPSPWGCCRTRKKHRVWLLELLSVSAPGHICAWGISHRNSGVPPAWAKEVLSLGGLSAVCNNVVSYLFSGVNILYCM